MVMSWSMLRFGLAKIQEDKSKYLSIYFSDDNIVIIDWLGNVIFENKYLPNWQQDVLNKLKELISD